MHLRLRAPLLTLLFASAACGGKTVDVEATADAATTVDTGGGSSDAATVPAPLPRDQRLLFEVGYVNYAWGFTYGGIYVTADGDVFRYDRPATSGADPAYPRLHTGMTEEEIASKYASNRELVGHVDAEELRAMYDLVTQAEEGALLGTSNCADAGDRTYVAWRYDAASRTYSPVTLGAEGDRAIESTSAAAKTLVGWLAKIGEVPRDGCAPMPRVACTGCATSPCPNAWHVAACDGACVSPTRCVDVTGCAACGKTGTCVLDGGARAHCSVTVSCTGRAPDCECAGDEICAGGKAWCRGTAASGFRCERP